MKDVNLLLKQSSYHETNDMNHIFENAMTERNTVKYEKERKEIKLYRLSTEVGAHVETLKIEVLPIVFCKRRKCCFLWLTITLIYLQVFSITLSSKLHNCA